MRIALALVAVSLMISSCGSVIFKTFSVENEPPESVALDAKQRVVLVAKRQNFSAGVAGSGSGVTATPSAGNAYRSDRIVCAEPSPDTMVGVAASLGLDLPLHTGTVGLDTSMAQAVAQIGTRSQTIQLLRDGLYRACEAYMNGTFSAADYELMLRHYDMTMVMLVAIDGLTRSCGKPAVISTSSSAQHAPPSPGKPDDQDANAPKAKNDAKDDAKDAPADAKAKAPAAGPSSIATANGSAQDAGQCAVSEAVAQQVDKMVEAFFRYKWPLHHEFCMQTVLERLLEVSKLDIHQAKADPQFLVEVKAGVDIAKTICAATEGEAPAFPDGVKPQPKTVAKKP